MAPISTIKYIFLSVTCYFLLGCVQEERLITGFVQEKTDNRFGIDLRHTGTFTYIGYLCDSVVCESVNEVKIGDEVLLTLGSDGGRNRLLAIRKCEFDDAECEKVKELDVKKDGEMAQIIKASSEKHKQCRYRMNEDLKNINLYFSGDLTESNNTAQIVELYNNIREQPEYKNCLSDFLDTYRNAVLKICKKYKCGEGIGGGCYHIVGYSVTTPVIEAAIEQCSI